VVFIARSRYHSGERSQCKHDDEKNTDQVFHGLLPPYHRNCRKRSHIPGSVLAVIDRG
jgi:hypothetical protein